MPRAFWLKLFLVLQGLWLLLDIPFLRMLGETGQASEPSGSFLVYRVWLATDVLLLCSVLMVWLGSRSGVAGFLVVTAAREGLLVCNGKGPSILGAGMAMVLVALVARHWKLMRWTITRTKTT